MSSAALLPLARPACGSVASAAARATSASPALNIRQQARASSSSSSSAPTSSRRRTTSILPQQQAGTPLPASQTPAEKVRTVQRQLALSAPASSRSRSISSTSTSAAAEAVSLDAAAAAAQPRPTAAAAWHPTSRRTGLITRKIGMTSFFLSTGQHVPATVLQVMSNQVSALIQPPVGAYTAMQIAAFDVHSRRGISATVKGHLAKAGITTSKRVLHEFRVTPDALLPLGTELSAVHFVPGQHVDVRAITRGKGFQGAMKRHGFHGLRASHGVSISHRSHGSTGQHQDPGRVFPGKKMAGRMGGTAHRTVQNARVLRIDSRDELIFVQGQVPGPEGGTVYVTDAKRALVGKAAIAYGAGKLRNGQLAQGNEPASEYLPEGVDDLPFPAGTKAMAHVMSEVVELGPVKRVAAAASS